MANETIELLKPYTPNKLKFPALHQQKIDGVPAFIIRSNHTIAPVLAYTRQGELITSIPHILKFCELILNIGDAIVMELYVPGLDFKTISGLVRKKASSAETRKLRGWAFDFIPAGEASKPYVSRRADLMLRLSKLAQRVEIDPTALIVRLLPGSIVNGPDEAEQAHDALMVANPNAEGSVLHSLEKAYQPGKRTWDTQKWKPTPTIDLRIVSFEEAVSADGKPLGMVGRINAEFTTFPLQVDASFPKPMVNIIGIGPGSMTHEQRKAQWMHWKRGDYKPRIAEIKYMRDDSYDALRQPTFVCWRDDKKEADTLAA